MYIHGGWNGVDCLEDLLLFDLQTSTWRRPVVRGDCPGTRAQHSMVSHKADLYVYGGYDVDALGNVFRYSTELREWWEVRVKGPRPYLYMHSMVVEKDVLYV